MNAVTTNQSPEVLAQRAQELPADALLHSTTGSEVHLKLLSLLEQKPTGIQRQPAEVLGVNLSKANYCLRALGYKGLIKQGTFSQNLDKLQYTTLLTPKCIAQKLQPHTSYTARSASLRS